MRHHLYFWDKKQDQFVGKGDGVSGSIQQFHHILMSYALSFLVVVYEILMIIVWLIFTIIVFNFKKNLWSYSIILLKWNLMRTPFGVLVSISWLGLIYLVTSRYQPLFNHPYISLYLLCKLVKWYIMNPYLAWNTIGWVYPYIPGSVRFFQNIFLLNYVPFTRSLLICLCSVVWSSILPPWLKVYEFHCFIINIFRLITNSNYIRRSSYAKMIS